MNIIFIVLESCLVMLSLVLAFLWMFHPQDSYEPTIVLFGVLLTAYPLKSLAKLTIDFQ